MLLAGASPGHAVGSRPRCCSLEGLRWLFQGLSSAGGLERLVAVRGVAWGL